MSAPQKCALRKCQGKRGCMCIKKPPKQEPVARIFVEHKKSPARPKPGAVKKSPPAKAVVSKPGTKPPPSKRAEAAKAKKSAAKEKPKEPKEKPEENPAEVAKPSEEVKEEAVPEPEAPKGPVKVTLKYNHYVHEFTCDEKGLLSMEVIDEEFALSFAFPNSKLHLSEKAPTDPEGYDAADKPPPYLKEEPAGTYHGLESGKEYFVWVEEAPEERAKYEAAQAEYMKNNPVKNPDDDEDAMLMASNFGGEDSASCSCIEGNPCMSKYNCKDWNNRFEVAKRNGW
eukprot:CAMPEP_0175142094 /NCGR_PEP_ID=MMETSP0087-20121206/12567_1 /TAXON_ID=136419 /ORGANISM="Unknown Unknown, Strain D1" /LENGTH=283 /DNA_ID=CAMNT_0016425777 /DNA_START=83 /DNA_END=931 /DNA_ORIENTATION=-